MGFLLLSEALANGYVHETDHPKWGRVATPGPFALLSKTPAEVRRHAPISPGDHSAEILREAGFSAEEITGFAQQRVVIGEGLSG